LLTPDISNGSRAQDIPAGGYCVIENYFKRAGGIRHGARYGRAIAFAGREDTQYYDGIINANQMSSNTCVVLYAL
jgi:hypothetical protein